MLKQILMKHKTLAGFIVILIFAATLPVWVSSPYYLDLLIITLVNAALSITFIMMLRTGLISLGMAAFWGIGAYLSAMMVLKAGMSFWVAMPVSAVVTGLVAVVLGYILIGSGSSGFTFVILSSVIGMLFTVAVGNISYLGGYSGIPNIPAPDPIKLPFLPALEFTSKVQYFYLAVVLFIVVVVIVQALYKGWIGRAWTAIGLSPRLAESIGIDIFKYKLLGFVVASAIAGLIGSFYAHYEGFVVPDSFNTWVNIYIQLYAILGGIGYVITGPLLGAAVMKFVPEAMRVANLIAPIVTGLILILLILFLPQGLLGLLNWRTSGVGKVKQNSRSIKAFFTRNRVDKA
jgi:branched-chain amino acid transport system permease protein